ncbi:hypothetical protein AC578_6498 [Pseudocercospora eumusae]|uniref:Uncharacterized protein n=1 Tax=Pseudocercospora eumusae TaxID=321146 RepID=A0A139HHR0_9PEZI|nr:hypothetical protein AC578_6498 [Pseudocercospora eumusae]
MATSDSTSLLATQLSPQLIQTLSKSNSSSTLAGEVDKTPMAISTASKSTTMRLSLLQASMSHTTETRSATTSFSGLARSRTLAPAPDGTRRVLKVKIMVEEFDAGEDGEPISGTYTYTWQKQRVTIESDI